MWNEPLRGPQGKPQVSRGGWWVWPSWVLAGPVMLSSLFVTEPAFGSLSHPSSSWVSDLAASSWLWTPPLGKPTPGLAPRRCPRPLPPPPTHPATSWGCRPLAPVPCPVGDMANVALDGLHRSHVPHHLSATSSGPLGGRANVPHDKLGVGNNK